MPAVRFEFQLETWFHLVAPGAGGPWAAIFGGGLQNQDFFYIGDALNTIDEPRAPRTL